MKTFYNSLLCILFITYCLAESKEDIIFSVRSIHPNSASIYTKNLRIPQGYKRYSLKGLKNYMFIINKKSMLNEDDIVKAKYSQRKTLPKDRMDEFGKKGFHKIKEFQPNIIIYLNDKGKKKLFSLTKNQLNNKIAIFLKNDLVMVPVVATPINSNKFTIIGKYSEKEAIEYVKAINNHIKN